VGDQG